MREFMTLIGQIVLICCIQALTELLIDHNKRPYQALVINVACFAGSLYLLLQFVFGYLLAEIQAVINMPF